MTPTRPDLPPGLRDRILASAVAAPPPARRSGAALALLFVIGGLWLVTLAMTFGRRHDWTALPAWTMWLPLISVVVAGLVTTALVATRGRQLLGAPVAWLLAAALAAPTLSGAIALFADQASGAGLVPPALALRSAVVCDVVALVTGAPLVVLVLVSLRRRVLPAPGLVGATAGVAAAVWAHALLVWHCDKGAALHVLVGHVAPALPLAALGAVLAVILSRRANRLRRAA